MKVEACLALASVLLGCAPEPLAQPATPPMAPAVGVIPSEPTAVVPAPAVADTVAEAVPITMPTATAAPVPLADPAPVGRSAAKNPPTPFDLPGDPLLGPGPEPKGYVANASSVVRGMRSQIRRCYQSQLKSDPKMEGCVRMLLTVDASGAVTNVSSEFGPGPNSLSQIMPCLSAAARRMRFAPPVGGGFKVSIPFTCD